MILHQQQELWRYQNLKPTGALHNLSRGAWIHGLLREHALRQAIDVIIARHASLRTHFRVAEWNAMIVGEAENEPVRVVDFTDFKQSNQETFLEDHLLQHSARTFDPAAGAPFRITLFRLGEQKHILILTVHTLSCDEWSADIFCKEVTYLYAAFADGIQSALREIPVQYDEHVRRLNRLLQGQKLQEQVSYWDRRLKQPLRLIQLPVRRSPDACPGRRAGSGELAFSPSLTDKLKTLSKAEDATLLTLLIAGFMVLLHRYTGEKDILVASQISGRDYPGTENSIGSFANTILLRGALSGQQGFLELLRRTRNMTLEAYSHQDFPCELLLDKMGQGDQQSPMMLNLTPGPHVKMEFAGSEAHPIEIESYAGNRDLVMSVVELPEGLVASCSVDRQLFDSEAIARLMRHLAVLLEDGANNPGLPIGQLSLLTDAERHQLETEWNDTQEEFATGVCIHDLIEAQSDRTPDAVALTCKNSHLTYRELDERANQVGRHLQRLGVRSESRVGVFSDRTLEMVIGLLGILKSGAAYLALDPAYPPERIAFMVDDAQASVILCQTDLVTYLPESEAQPVYLEAVCSAGVGESREKCPVNVGSNNAAYLIYTSGSTGSPKGVVIEHHSAVVFMQWARNVFGSDDLSGILASTSICFDLSVFELFFPLSCGGKIILVENALSASELCLRQVSLINTGPSIMARMLKTDRLMGSVNTVNLAGEVLKSDLVQRIYAQGVRRVFNLYGPSEDTTYTTFSLIKDDAIGPPVIGRPISNSQIYLLDESHQPVPGGAPGELYIGGEGLARGYLDRPEITAEKFVPNPFGAKSGARLYKTGDLSRYLSDGNVDFIGRIDHQVKIHGLRIELGEIEVVLAQSQAVREAVVIARANDSPNDSPNDSEDSRLVAYVVPARTPAPTEAELRQYLVDKLPHYMVPSAFVIMTGLPLTPNGKVDRKALLEAEAGGEPANEPFVGPRTPLEESLAKIWGDVLSRPPIGVRDNFFRLGGHSLLGARVISRVRDEWHVNLYLDALFRAPTVAEMAILITERRAEQGPKNDLSEILTELEEPSEKSATASEETIPLERVRREGALALSFAQERLWFFEQLEGSKGVYNCPSAVRVKGDFRVEAFEQAVREVIRRQESLQTVFPTEGGRPAQVIKRVERRWAEMVNLSELADGAEEMAERLMTEAGRKPFDLEQGPLIRVVVMQVGEKEHVVVITMHHIVTDGWSQRLFFKELTQAYEEYGEGRRLGLQEVEIQYADYAAWQRKWMRGEALERQVEYWRKRIGKAPPVMDLAMDRARAAEQRYEGKRKRKMLPGWLCSELREVSLREGATLYMTLLAGFKALLSRYTEREQIVVGTPTAGRNRVEIERLIGFFVNTLVLNSNIEMGMSFREAIREIREVVLGAHANQDLPFEKLVEELRPERSLSHHPMFQVMFILEGAEEELRFGGAEARYEDVDIGVAKFDLTLAVIGSGDRLEAEIEYNEGLFDGERVSRMLGHYQMLLEGAVGNVESRVGELPILTENERHQIVTEWNETETARSKSRRIHDLLERQAERTPDRIAVVNGAEALSYEGLNRRANELAGRLREMGVGAEVVVGVCMRRSLKMVVGMIAVMKAGGAYLPLDPEYPDERLAYLVEDSGTSIVLTERRHVGTIRDEGIRKLCLDEGSEDEKVGGEGGVESGATAGNLAYVIYTSGSTGRPKGVAIEHRSAAALIEWATEVFAAEEFGRVLASTSICFDLSVFEIFAPLSVGGEVNLVENALAANEAHDVTLINTVPTAVRELLREGALCESVLTVNLAGEALSSELVSQLRSQRRVKNIYNLYGPSEDTTYSSFARVNEYCETAPPIGRPIADTEIYVLDRRGEPQAVGIPGELQIGGEGLARGYIGQAALTAEKFTPNPIGRRIGERMYATGDTGRYLIDGSIQYVGRKDQQVKLRGFRIELGEIEEVIRQHGAVKEGVVIVREDRAGDRRLVAYLAPVDGYEIEIKKLRTYLKSRLPEYMVPGEFVVLNDLPLTHNGKVDRRALPLTDISSSRPEGVIALPETPTQESLAKIWGETLSLAEVGIEDNFFDLGGHSILATQLISRIRDTFNVEFPLRTIFEKPTVAELASRIDAALESDERSSLPPIEPLSVPGKAADLSFSQQRIWYLDVIEPGNIAYNIPIPLYLAGELNSLALAQSINRIVCRHSALRTRFQSVDGKPAQVVDASVPVSWPIIDIDRLPETQRETLVGQLARAEARRPFDLTNGPLLRCALLRLRRDEHVLLLSVHHIIFDEWSMRVVFAELEELYRAFTAGRCSTLPEMTIQYADFALWQREWLMSGTLKRQLAYWREKLWGVPAALTIAADRRRPPIQTYAGAYETMDLSEELSRKIEALNKKEGVALFVTLLTAFKALICHHTGQRDIVVGTSIANRNRTEAESLIGFFVNTLALRTKFDGDPPVSELLRLVRDTVLGAYDHQDVPFDRLIEELRPERDARFSPIFQIAFEFQSSPLTMPGLPGLRVLPVSVDPGTAHFDLTLGMENDGKRLSATVEYNTDLYDPTTIAQLLKDYRTLLESAVLDGDQRLSTWLSAVKTVSRSVLGSDLGRSDSVGSSSSLEREVALRRARLESRRSRMSAEQRGWLDRQLRGE